MASACSVPGGVRIIVRRLGRPCWGWSNKGGGGSLPGKEGETGRREPAGCQTFYLSWFPRPPLEAGSIVTILYLSNLRLGGHSGLNQNLTGEVRMVPRDGQLTGFRTAPRSGTAVEKTSWPWGLVRGAGRLRDWASLHPTASGPLQLSGWSPITQSLRYRHLYCILLYWFIPYHTILYIDLQ